MQDVQETRVEPKKVQNSKVMLQNSPVSTEVIDHSIPERSLLRNDMPTTSTTNEVQSKDRVLDPQMSIQNLSFKPHDISLESTETPVGRMKASKMQVLSVRNNVPNMSSKVLLDQYDSSFVHQTMSPNQTPSKKEVDPIRSDVMTVEPVPILEPKDNRTDQKTAPENMEIDSVDGPIPKSEVDQVLRKTESGDMEIDPVDDKTPEVVEDNIQTLSSASDEPTTETASDNLATAREIAIESDTEMDLCDIPTVMKAGNEHETLLRMLRQQTNMEKDPALPIIATTNNHNEAVHPTAENVEFPLILGAAETEKASMSSLQRQILLFQYWLKAMRSSPQP